MKTINYIALGIGFLWVIIMNAQPMLNQAEKYAIGTAASFFTIDTATINEGASGAGIVWDFTQVSTTGQPYGEQYISPTQTQWADSFITSTLTRKADDGTYYFLKDEDSVVWLEGLWLDFSSILLTFNKPQQILTRPLHFGDGYLGTAYYTYNYQNFKYRGGGEYKYTVDGYGEVRLQSGTYPNVLRMKFESDYYDTLINNPSSITRTKTTTYYWYNPYNPSPIVQINKVEISSPNFNSFSKYAYILKNPSTAVQQASSEVIKAWVNNDNLRIEGLDQNNTGTVLVYDIAGKQVAKGNLICTDGAHVSQLSKQLGKGIYLLNINIPQGHKTIKIAIL